MGSAYGSKSLRESSSRHYLGRTVCISRSSVVLRLNDFASRLTSLLKCIKNMISLKQTQRSIVKLAFDGKIHKRYLGALAFERLANEVRVLQHLEASDCSFVPRVVSYSLESMSVVMTNCGQPVQLLSDEKVAELFATLTQYGVEHEDASLRNVTYRATDGRFCLIDFEFATIINPSQASYRRIDDTFDEIDVLLSDVN